MVGMPNERSQGRGQGRGHLTSVKVCGVLRRHAGSAGNNLFPFIYIHNGRRYLTLQVITSPATPTPTVTHTPQRAAILNYALVEFSLLDRFSLITEIFVELVWQGESGNAT